MGFVGGGGAGPNEVFVQGDVSVCCPAIIDWKTKIVIFDRHVRCVDLAETGQNSCCATNAIGVNMVV